MSRYGDSGSWKFAVISIGMILFVPDICLAYIGPGSGVTMLGAVLAVAAALLFTVAGVLFWPVRLLLRLIKKGRNGGGTDDSLSGTEGREDGEGKVK